MEVFQDNELQTALDRKLQLEKTFVGDDEVEVALFESQDEPTLRVTHSRYFQSAADIAERLSKAG